MPQVPDIRILSADPREIRPIALRAPLKRMVVNRLPESRIVAVTQNVGHKRTNHLRMTRVAAFAHVEIASRQLKRGIHRLTPVLQIGSPLSDNGGDNLDQAAGENGN